MNEEKLPIEDVNISPIPFTESQKMRFSELAKDLEDARVCEYIKANFGIKALEVLQSVIPILGGLL